MNETEDETMSSKQDLYTEAAAAVAAGFHVNPFCAAKASPLPKGYLAEHTADEVDAETLRLIKSGKATGFGIAVGPRGVFERDGVLLLPVVLEHEGRASADDGWQDRWRSAVEDFDSRDLMGRLEAGLVDASPSGGVHWTALVPVPTGVDDLDQQIASLPAVKAFRIEDADSENPSEDPDAKKRMTMAELLVTSRGVIAAPSGGPTHPSGQPWVRQTGGFDSVPVIGWADLFRLSEILAAVTEVEDPDRLTEEAPLDNRTARTAALINKAGTTDATKRLLEANGWKVMETFADGQVWMERDGHSRVEVGNPRLPAGACWAWGESFPLGARRIVRWAELRAHFEFGGDLIKLTEKALVDGEVRLRVWALSPSRKPEIVVPTTPTTQIAETVADAMVTAQHRALKGTPFVLAKESADGRFAGFASVTASNDVRNWLHQDDLALLATSVAQPLKSLKIVVDKETGEEHEIKTFEHAFPKTVVRMALETAQQGVSPVRHVASTPLLLPDGRTLAEPGYHVADRALVAIPTNQRRWWSAYSVPEKPTPKDAQRALDWLLGEVLVDFPFATPNDRARGVLYLLTCVSRSLFTNCPGFLMSAPDRGSGKDLLAEAGRRLPTGTSACQLLSTSSDQTERNIVTALLQGNPFIHMPEIPRDRVWKDNTLQAALTGDSSLSMRILGGNNQALLSGRIFTACGNNAQLGSDLLRRFIEIRLEWTGEGMPEERSGFRHTNLLQWINANRPRIVAACHTVLAHGIQTLGTSYDKHSMGSFEGWVQVVLGAASLVEIDGVNVASLAWADRRQWSQAQDDEGSDWIDLMRSWRNLYGDQWVATSKAATEIVGMSPAPALPGPLVQQVGVGPAGMARAWGIALRSRARTRVRDGEETLLFEVREDPKRGNKYRVVAATSLAVVTTEALGQPAPSEAPAKTTKAHRRPAPPKPNPKAAALARTSTRGRHTAIDLGESA